MEEAPKSRLPLGIPQLIGLVVLVLFWPWVFLTVKNERDMRRAIETYEPLALPAFSIKFSKTMPFDSLGFQGKGLEAGFWQWTPTGLVLADKGKPYFSETSDTISSLVGAGKRQVTHIDSYQDRDGKRYLLFRYRWTEINPVTVLLLKPPEPDTDYQGTAVLVKQDGGWKLESLKTPDFDQPMALLVDITSGVKR